jgi:antitoxin Phd
MNVYTYTEARQKLAALLDKALQEGEVLIRRKDGQVFVVKPQPRADSPLNVEGIDLSITTPEIIAFIQESRRIFDLQS